MRRAKTGQTTFGATCSALSSIISAGREALDTASSDPVGLENSLTL